ncbi:MAG: methyltransferase domain-containing protein [bacterium]|nr:methyltransferase domain-containing protein [bacterium]
MDPAAMAPFGAALMTFFEGDTGAELIVRRDDGQVTALPVGMFFRDPSSFTPIDQAGVHRCIGRVLDAGAGTGLHSLVLQEKGLTVTAIDISPQAVQVMKQRGVTDVRGADVFGFQGGPFDTLLMLGHGVGMVETIAGLDRFLTHTHKLVVEGGQVLLDSLDVRVTDDPINLAYHEANLEAGRYIGETRVQFEFAEKAGPYCGWLHVDADTLHDHAASAGWHCEVAHREPTGDYLARLTKRGTL